MLRISISVLGFVFLILLTIVELFLAGILPMWYLTAVMLSITFCALGALLIIKKGRINIKINPIAMLPLQWGIYIIYNLFLYIFKIGTPEFQKSSLIQSTIPMIILLGGYAFYAIFENYALKYFICSVFLNFILVLIIQFYKMGVTDFFAGISSVFNGLSVNNPFEKNADAIFCLGLYFIYMCNREFWNQQKTKKYKFVLMLLLLILCGKRSQFLALSLIALFFIIIGRHVSEKMLYRLEKGVSIAFIIIYYVYIYLIANGELITFLYDKGINGMGRLQMWGYVSQFITFSPKFMGNGYSFSTLMLESNRIWTYNDAVYGLHGSVIGFYSDLGFIMFGLWLVINMLIIPSILKRVYDRKISDLYWMMTVYLFVLYLTESSINHFMTQSLYIIILLHAVNSYCKKNQSYVWNK